MTVRAVPKQAFFLVAGASFGCGALTIALEMILMKVATRYMGSASDGTTMALTVYLLGLLAGAALVLKLNAASSNINSNSNASAKHAALLPSLVMFILTIAVFILGNVAALDASNFSSAQGGLVWPICAGLILLPACLAGTIFPLLVMLCNRFYFGSVTSFLENKSQIQSSNSQVILLYLLSNLGSALGAMAGAIWLLPRLGITQSFNFIAAGYFLSAFLLAPLAVAAQTNAKKTPGKVLDAEQKQNSAAIEGDGEAISLEEGADQAIMSTSGPFFYASVFIAATAALLFECLAIRIMNLLCGASFVTTSCVIAATLLALSLGSRIALLLPANKNTRLTLAMALSFAALGLAMTVLLLPHLNNIFQAMRHLAFSQLSDETRHARWLVYLYPRLILSLIFCIPGATGLSLIFPVAVKGASRSRDMLSLYVASGLGTALAPVVFMLGIGHTLPRIDFSGELILRLLVVLLSAFAIVCLRDRAFLGKKAGEALLSKAFCFSAIAAAVAVLFLIRPVDVRKIDLGLSFVPATFSVKEVEEDARTRAVLFFKEGRTATISVVANGEDNTASLRSDGKIEGTVPIDSKAPALASDVSTQSMLALLPLLCQKTENKIQSCFLIGYGTGTTAATIIKALPQTNLKIAEIEPVIVRAGQCFKENAPLIKSNLVTTGDARHILQSDNLLYDLIISQPSEPWVQGSTNLFSNEFYHLIKSRLNKNGMFCQWLQLYGMDTSGLASALTTIESTFTNCLVYHPPGAGEILVLAFNGDIDYSPRTIANNIAQENLRILLARQSINEFQDIYRHLISPKNLRSALKKWQDTLPDVHRITDDNLALELASVPEIENAPAHVKANLSLLSGEARQGVTRTIKGPDLTSVSLADKALAEFDRGNEKGSATLAEIVLAGDPDCALAMDVQAMLALSHGQVDQAQKFITKSVQINPGTGIVHLLQSLAMLYHGNSAQAIQEADVAHRLDKLDYRPYILAAAAYHLGGDNPQALANIKKARQICLDDVILKQVDGLAGEFARPLPSSESITYSGTLASRLTTFLRGISSSSSTRCNYVF